ncbi:lantibiotic dehydratase [Roseivirga sp. BDSF3-8]|uniref:lantibiotic dehydratase n=1 Tax=Roseivirga sp. BDSF3-8 TaxID=3241598 RepID=UPI003531B008
MEVFPHVLIRTGGGTFEKLQRLNADKSVALAKEISELRQKKAADKEALSDSLMEFIKGLENNDYQKLLTNIRRDIYNDRNLKQEDLDAAKDILNAQQTDELKDYLALEEKLAAKEEEGEGVFNQELIELRKDFQEKLSDDELLKQGLVLSSQSLLNRMSSYIRKEPAKFRKKEVQSEQSLLKYYTRMYGKTSPFSTFTNLVVGKVAQLDGEKSYNISSENGEQEITGHIRLNNYLFKYIYGLFRKSREIYMWLPLRPNPTIEQKEDHFLYLTNNNNIESFQRIPANQVVDLFRELASKEPQGVRFKDIIKDALEYIDASEEDLEAYIQQFIDYGFLEYNIGVSGIDPDWDYALKEKVTPLAGAGVPHIQELLDTLDYIRTLAGKYADAEFKERKMLLKEAYEKFRAICMKIHEAAGLPEDERKTNEEREAERREKAKAEKEKAEGEGENKEENKEEQQEDEEKEEVFKHEESTTFTFKPEQMFYEDTTREVDATLDSERMHELVGSLNDLLQEMRLFRGHVDEREKMRHYFVSKYGDTASVNLLTYYEDFFRDYKKPEAELQEKKKELSRLKSAAKKDKKTVPAGESEPEGQDDVTRLEVEIKEMEATLKIPGISERQEFRESWQEKYLSLLDGGKLTSDHVEVEISKLRETNKLTGSNGHDAGGKNSYGMFTQLFNDPEDGRMKAMINASFSGYGKMFSRFLHIFDKVVTEDQRRYNVNVAPEDTIFVEDCDASYFNANLHPPLMPFEVWMPGGHNSLPEDKQLAITDFEIRCENGNDLVLFHKPSEKRAHVFDLGFQGHMGRSQLFQLLEKFTYAEYLFVNPLLSALTKKRTNLLQEEKGGQSEENKKDNTTKVMVSPRYTYGDLVLQRKSWSVPKELLPTREGAETEWQYFNRVDAWRRELGIPDEVFVFLNPGRQQSNDPEAAKKLGRDDYKPQYISFKSPALILMLDKMMAKVPGNMKIDEMLPSPDSLLHIDGKPFVSECVVQWYK